MYTNSGFITSEVSGVSTQIGWPWPTIRTGHSFKCCLIGFRLFGCNNRAHLAAASVNTN